MIQSQFYPLLKLADYLRFILIFYPSIFLGLPDGLFPRNLSSKIMYAFVDIMDAIERPKKELRAEESHIISLAAIIVYLSLVKMVV
jgi:hypothetical protein